MLTQIHIRDLATIETLELNLHPHASMITGETGAGKSIFLEALELALGARGSANMIRPGKERADISLCFDLSHFPQAVEWLKAHDLHHPQEKECIIRRVLTQDGRSRSYINGLPTTLPLVRDLGEMVFHLHGQYDQQVLFKADNQRDMLDRFAEHAPLAKQVREAAEQWKTLESRITQLREKSAERAHRLDYLRFQLDELSAASLRAGEWEALESEHHRLTHAEALLQDVQHAIGLIQQDDAPCIQSQLNEVRKRLESAAHVDSRAEAWLKQLNEITIPLADLDAELNDYIEHTDLDPARLAEVEARIGQLYDLARKHKVQPAELLAFESTLQSELSALTDGDASLDALMAEQASVMKQYQTLAKKLTHGRTQAAPKLAKIITNTVRSLSLPHADFQIQLDTETQAITAHGQEKISFLIKTNPDQHLQPLAKVVSGGELSRLSLAAHLALAHVCSTPTLIFDEVDTGVGGATAEKIGKLLRELGEAYQVFCVTHQAQVAACGHHHLFVEKQFIGQSTHTHLRYLTASEKRNEIARMLGGEKITETTRAHADEMLATLCEAT